MASPIQEDLHPVLTRNAATLAQLRRAGIFVTGATGFFGTWLLELLLAANRRFALRCRVVALSRDPGRFLARSPHLADDPCLSFVEGDVRDFRFPSGTVTHVIHAAADATASPGSPNGGRSGDAFSVCVDGTRRVLDLAAEKRSDRFLFVSSGAVYGRQPTDLEHVPEDYPGGGAPSESLGGYAAGKREAERLCVTAARQTGWDAGRPAVTVARCFAFVGPHLPLDAHFAIGNFIRDAIHGDTIRVAGDGTPHRSYLYAADLVEWLVALLLRGASRRAYNVGSEEPVAIGDLARRVARAAATLWPERGRPDVTMARTPDPRSAPDRYVPACVRARSELGLVQRVSLDDAIMRTMTWAASVSRVPLFTPGV